MKKESGRGAIGLLGKSRGWLVCALLIAMSPFVFGGCFGSFP